MDVLRPPVVWIDGRCYRKFANYAENAQASYEEEEVTENIGPDSQDVILNLQEECDYEYDIEEVKGGKFQTDFHIASSYFGHIIGTRGGTKKRIENETRTQIHVPPHGKSGNIFVTGNDRKKVASARARVELIVQSARTRQPFTHFLSIPLLNGSIKKGFLQFKSKALENHKNVRGMDESLFQNVDKLHLTIGTLALMDEYERREAAAILQECKQDILEPVLGNKPLVVTMRGLEIMNDDPSEVDVLYAIVEDKDESYRLQSLADELVAKFVSSNLMHKQFESVKIHATVMNSLFRQDTSGVTDNEFTRSKNKPRETFSAVELLQAFENFRFGECTLSDIQISERYSTNKTTGYYTCTDKLLLPR